MLVRFPAARRVADVRWCAEQLQMVHGEQANRFWRTEMASFAASMREQGFSDEEISREAADFMMAVQIELQHRCAAAAAL